MLGTSDSSSGVGAFGFGGVEWRLGSSKQLGLSGDIGYYSTATPFVGLRIGGFCLRGLVALVPLAKLAGAPPAGALNGRWRAS